MRDQNDIQIDADGMPDPPGLVQPPEVADLPTGYRFGVTRYSDIILRHSFPARFEQLMSVLDEFRIDVTEILSGGGSKAPMTKRFDQMLSEHGWGKRNITIAKSVDDRLIHSTRGHEIDMFAAGPGGDGFPGIAVEVEWNNKDPFFDRDLLNYMALHREGVLAIGVIVTRGPELQRIIGNTVITSKDRTSMKYGQSTTHWNKLTSRVNLGGGGECPLLLVGMEPARVDGVEYIRDAFEAGQRIW